MQKSRQINLSLWSLVAFLGGLSAQSETINDKCRDLPEPTPQNCSKNGPYYECQEAIELVYREGVKDGQKAVGLYKDLVQPYMKDAGEYHGEGDASGSKSSATLARDTAQNGLQFTNGCTTKMEITKTMLYDVRGRLGQHKDPNSASCDIDAVNDAINAAEQHRKTCADYSSALITQKTNAEKLITHASAKLAGENPPPLNLADTNPTPGSTSSPASTAPPTATAPEGAGRAAPPKTKTEPSATVPQVASTASPLPVAGASVASPKPNDPILGQNGAGYGTPTGGAAPRAPANAPTSSSSSSGSGAMMPALMGAVGGGVVGYMAGRANRTTSTITNTSTITVTNTDTNAVAEASTAIDCAKLGFTTNADGTCNASSAVAATNSIPSGAVVAPQSQVVSASNGGTIASVATNDSGVYVQGGSLALVEGRASALEIDNPDCANPAFAQRASCLNQKRALGAAQRAILCSRNPSDALCRGL